MTNVMKERMVPKLASLNIPFLMGERQVVTNFVSVRMLLLLYISKKRCKKLVEINQLILYYYT